MVDSAHPSVHLITALAPNSTREEIANITQVWGQRGLCYSMLFTGK